MSTIVKHWSVTSKCHKLTRRSSALMNVSCRKKGQTFKGLVCGHRRFICSRLHYVCPAPSYSNGKLLIFVMLAWHQEPRQSSAWAHSLQRDFGAAIACLVTADADAVDVVGVRVAVRPPTSRCQDHLR